MPFKPDTDDKREPMAEMRQATGVSDLAHKGEGPGYIIGNLP